MSLVVAVDELAHHRDLEVARRVRQRRAHLIEREHHLEEVLERGLGHLRVAGQELGDAGIDARGVGRGEIAGYLRFGGVLGLGDHLVEQREAFFEAAEPVRGAVVRLAFREAAARVDEVSRFGHSGSVTSYCNASCNEGAAASYYLTRTRS